MENLGIEIYFICWQNSVKKIYYEFELLGLRDDLTFILSLR